MVGLPVLQQFQYLEAIYFRLRSFYSREDLERDGVVYKKYGSKRESRVPLLEFTPTLSFYSGC